MVLDRLVSSVKGMDPFSYANVPSPHLVKTIGSSVCFFAFECQQNQFQRLQVFSFFEIFSKRFDKFLFVMTIELQDY